MVKKTKFVHMMPQGSSVWDYSLIRMFDEETLFHSDEHNFVVSSKKLYNMCTDYKNVIYDVKMIENLSENKNYLKNADIVFLHSNTMKMTDLAKLTPREKKKIVWCVWGHDVYLKTNGRFSNNLLKHVLKTIKYKLYDYLLKEIKGVGVGFYHDSYEVKNRLGYKTKIYNAPYFHYDLKMDYFKSEINTQSISKALKIMIGHSAYPFLNHKKIIDLLSKYKDENIIISLVLSYGSSNYKSEVIAYSKEIFGEKTEVIEDGMDVKSYIDYLKNVDVAIFDHLHQSALGNIYYLLYLNKKLFLNEEGIIAKALFDEKIEYQTVSSIMSMNYQTFSSLNINDNLKQKEFAQRHFDPEVIKNIWWETINEIKNDCS